MTFKEEMMMQIREWQKQRDNLDELIDDAFKRIEEMEEKQC